MKKVLLVTNIPNPYRISLFNEAHRLFTENGLQLKLVFGASGYSRRKFVLDEGSIHFKYEILNDNGISLSKDAEKTYFLYKGLSALLRRESPDVIIVAGFSLATMKVFRYHLFNKVPYIIYSGSTGHIHRKLNIIRTIQRNILLKYAAAFVVYGNRAGRYLSDCGVPAGKIFTAINTVDTQFYSTETEKIQLTEKQNNLKHHFTYLGYLVPRKKVEELLHAVKILASRRTDFHLDILGDGVSRASLEAFTSEHGLSDLVTFHGFKQKQEIPAFFARSSGLMFQTGYDIWGLVLNEAMAAGLTCIVTPNAGAVDDLITEGVTGFIVDYKNHKMVADKMEWIINHPEESNTIGDNAKKFIQNNATIAHSASGFVKAVVHVLNNSN